MRRHARQIGFAVAKSFTFCENDWSLRVIFSKNFIPPREMRRLPFTSLQHQV